MTTIVDRKSIQTQNIKFFLNLGIICLLMFGFKYLPPLGAITPLGMAVLGVFLGLLYGWTTLDMYIPSLIGMVAFCFTGYMTSAEFVQAGFGNAIVILTIFSLIFMGGLVAKFDLTKIILSKIFSAKFLIGRPWKLTICLILANWLVSCFVSPYIVIIFMFQIIFSIAKAVGYKPSDAWPRMMLISCALGCSVGIVVMPYNSTTLMFIGTLTAATGIEVNWGSYLIMSVTLSLAILMGFVLACKLIFRPDVSKLTDVTTEQLIGDNHVTITREQKIAIGAIFAGFLLLLLPSFLPKAWLPVAFLTRLEPLGIFMVLIVILLCIRIDGKPFLVFEDLAKGMQWNVFLIMAIAMPVITALTNPQTGITNFVIASLAPLLAGKSNLIFLLLVVAITLLMTNYLNNMVVILVMTPIICGYAAPMGLNVASIIVVIIIMGYMAILTPAASPLTAIMFSYQEWVTTKVGYLYGGLALLVCIIVALVIGIPLGNLLL